MPQDTQSDLESTESESLDTTSEGVSNPEEEGNPSVSEEETNELPSSHEDIFDDSEEVKTKSEALEKKQRARESARENIVNKAYEQVLSGELKSIDKIKQDWVREEVETRFAEDDQQDSFMEEFQDMKAEMNRMKDKSEVEKSKAMFDSVLLENNISLESFQGKYWDNYVTKVRQLRDKGLSKVDSTELALQTLGLGDHDERVEAEERDSLSESMGMPKDNGQGRSISGFNRREFDNYNRDLKNIGVSPLSKEAFLAGKKAGQL